LLSMTTGDWTCPLCHQLHEIGQKCGDPTEGHREETYDGVSQEHFELQARALKYKSERDMLSNELEKNKGAFARADRIIRRGEAKLEEAHRLHSIEVVRLKDERRKALESVDDYKAEAELINSSAGRMISKIKVDFSKAKERHKEEMKSANDMITSLKEQLEGGKVVQEARDLAKGMVCLACHRPTDFKTAQYVTGQMGAMLRGPYHEGCVPERPF
jgi:hypothetical protein